MNRFGNYHTHCYLCDGAGTPAEYATRSVEAGLFALGFSSHAPLPFPIDWVMDRDDLPVYVEEIERAKQATAGAIPLYTGLEIDYVPGVTGPDRTTFAEIELDFVIGSVHFVQSPDGRNLAVDGPIEEFTANLEDGFGGDIKAMVTAYYRNLRGMLEHHTPDILGHFDVIRKNNEDGRFFDPSETWYRNEVLETITAAETNGCIVEVNTGALARGKQVLYPEPWIAEELARHRTRMMVNTDAHAPEHLGHGYDLAFELLRETGHTEHWLLGPSGWQPFPTAAG